MMGIHKILSSLLIVFQVVGPSWFILLQTSKASAQEISGSQARIAGLRGVVTVIPGTNDRPGYSPVYRSLLIPGDLIATEEESAAELLLDNQGLITIQEYSEVLIGEKSGGGISPDLRLGAAEWSLPLRSPTQTVFSLSTPNIRATSQGGLITAEVQATLSDTAEQPGSRKSFVVRTSLRAQSNPPGNVALLETFCVKEGTLQVDYPGTQSGTRDQKEIPVGQCVGFFNGALRAMGDEHQIADWRAICAVGSHCEIPESAKKLIAKKQMKQALALEEALLGSDAEEGAVDEDIILATTGLLLAGAIQGASGPGGLPPDPGILPCTGTPEFCAGFDGTSPGSNVGGSNPPTAGPGGSAGGRPSPGTNIQTLTTLVPGGVSGGIGSLLFLDGNFAADKELLLVDSGIKADAPHMGIPPSSSLVVSSLSPVAGSTPSNQNLPLQFLSFNQPGAPTVQLGVAGPARQDQAQQLAQFARSNSINPNDILVGIPENGAGVPCATLLDCFEIILALGGQGTFASPETDSGIDGSIQARSSSTIDPALGLPGATRDVTLKNGVVLVNTTASLARQSTTVAGFSGVGTIVETSVEGSALSFLGKPGDPAIVRLEDRALALLEGSRIQPGPNQPASTSLLAIVDSQLTGPQGPSVIGKDLNGNDIVRLDISPIVENIDSSIKVETGVVVASTASASQTGVLDQALLEASSPLLAMIRGTMEAASDFGQIGGRNAKVMANLVAGDALVRLDASSLTVNGNLFNVTGGGQLLVTGGALLALQGNSIANINGTLVSVTGAGSLFSLTGGSLVDFGGGTNMVNISNNLCGGGGCFAPFSDPSLMVSGNAANFSAPAGYNPFVDAGSFADGSLNTVNVTPGSAILEVQAGGAIQIQ